MNLPKDDAATLSARWIEGVLLNIAGKRPALRRQQRIRDARLSTIDRLNNQRAINRLRNRRAHAHIAQNRIAQIEDQIVEDRARPLVDGEARIARQRVDQVGAQRIALHIRRPLLQLERARGVVRHYRETNARKRRRHY